MDQQKIGRFISELRKELGMTQTELGEKLGRQLQGRQQMGNRKKSSGPLHYMNTFALRLA